MKKIFGVILILSLLTVGIISAIGGYYFYWWSYAGEEKSLVVNAGEGFASINSRLLKENFIPSARAFHYLARYQNRMSDLNQGSFTIKPGMKLGDILDLLCGPSEFPLVRIPEGKNLYEVAAILQAAGILKAQDFIHASVEEDLRGLTFAPDAPSVEGYLYPESYRFAPNTSAPEVIKEMIRQFHLSTKELNFNHPFLSPHEVIVLASIVEKETGASFEREIIAGVFTNRLKKHMRLQSDPTTIYGRWANFNGNLRKQDLQEKNLYNTYAIAALPLGPIANPSLEAIKAVLSPQQHSYLYFVSKNDGTHFFSSTYAEHDRAVTTYQRTKANREGKSWRQLKQTKH